MLAQFLSSFVLDPLPLLKAIAWWGYVLPTLVWCLVMGPIVVLLSPMLKQEAGSWPKFFLVFGGMLLFVGPLAFAAWTYDLAQHLTPRWRPFR
jgi:hypothetical protein